MAESYNVQENSFPAFDFSDYFFRPLPADIRYKKVTWHTYDPVSSIGNSTKNIYITLPKWDSNSHYLLDKALLKIKLSVTDENGTALKEGSFAGPVNNILWSLFEDCQIKINNVSISRISNMFGYKNIIETLMSYDTSPKATFLRAAGYTKDFEGTMDDKTNPGFHQRESFFSEQNELGKRKWNTNPITFIGKLLSDLDGCPGILNGCEIRIQLTLTSPEFFFNLDPATYNLDDNLSAEPVYKIKPRFNLSSCSISIPVAELSDSIAVSIERRLKDIPARYHFRRRGVIPYIIPKASRVFNASGVFPSNDVPARIVIGFTTSAAMKGSFIKNAYNFAQSFGDSCKISEVKCTLNGNNVDGFHTDDIIANYYKTFINLDLIENAISNAITFPMFLGGYFLLTFDFTTASNAGLAFQAPVTRQGQVIFDVTFTSPAPEELVLLCYCEHASNFQISAERKIQTNF